MPAFAAAFPDQAPAQAAARACCARAGRCNDPAAVVRKARPAT